MRKHKIIFVHGFGVKKDARGMFSEVKESLSKEVKFKNIESILVDLNTVTDNSRDIYLNSLSKQAEILKSIYKKEDEDECTFDLICHSQGCVVASIAMLPNIRKIFFLAPPTNNDIQKTIDSFKERSGTKIDLTGESLLMRKDGSRTVVSKEYWSDRKGIDYLSEYRKLLDICDIVVILGNQDETASNEIIEQSLRNSTIIKIDGNHNFEGLSRISLINTIKKYLQSLEGSK